MPDYFISSWDVLKFNICHRNITYCIICELDVILAKFLNVVLAVHLIMMRKMGVPSAPPDLAATGMRRVKAAVKPNDRART
jgi:hypothetical protein